jgi:tetratricopeptide (TPR) repeat protein
MPDHEPPGSGRLDPQQSRVWLQLLGEPRAFVDGQPVKVASKSLGLLAYLMLEGKTQRREIAVQLWPDSQDVLNNLSVAGAGLRRALGQDVLLLEADMVQLSAVVTCDLIQYRSLANADPENLGLGNLALEHSGPEDWARALEAWGPFMLEYRLSDWAQGQGVEFEDWLEQTREVVNTEREALALKLFTHHVRSNRFEAAGAMLETHLQSVLALREDVARWGMLVLGVLGQTSGLSGKIDTIYARLVRGLRSELEVEPTSITREAFEVARKGQTQECKRRLETELPAEQEASPPAKPAPRLGPHEAQFVGRRAELRSIRERFAQLGNGSAFVFLNGEPGAGKTRLALEASELIGREQPKVSALFAATAATGLLLNSFERLLDGLIAALQPGSSPKLEPLSGVQRDALARLLSDPARHGLETPITSALSPELERRNLFDAARALLNQTGLERQQPVLLVIDDLQWSDQASLDLIEHLLVNPPEHGLCIIGIARNTETPTANLNALLARITRQQDTLRLPIGALEEADCASLAAHFGRDEIDPNGLLRATGGNPLYLVELLRAEPGTSARRVQDLLRSRLETTPELERQTLEALAVLGNAVNLPAIKQTAGRSLDESLTALEGLRTAALVIEDATGFRFHHDLTRELVLEDLYPARAGLLNLRAAKARADTPILAANHYWAAKDLLEPDDATQAGQAFLHVASVHAVGNDLEVGLQWFDRAFEMARDGQEKIRVLTEKARMLMLYRRYDLTEEVLALAELLDDESHPLTTVRVLNSRASEVLGRSSDADLALRLSKKALLILDQLSGTDAEIERAETLSNMGVSYEIIFDFQQAKPCLEQALELHRKIGDRVKIGKSLRVLGWFLARQTDPRAYEMLDEEIRLWNEIGNKQSVVYAYTHLGMYWLNLENHLEAEKCLLKSIDLAIQEQIEDSISLTYNNLGAVYFSTKEFQKAEKYYQKAAKIADLEKNNFRIALIFGNLAELSIYMRQPGKAREYTEKGRIALLGTIHDAKLADLVWFEAETHVLEGQIIQAQNCFLESKALAQKSQHKTRLAHANARLARLNGNLELAQQALELLESPNTRASLEAVQGQSEAALKTIKALNDTYEEYRLLLDLQHLTGNPYFLELAQGIRTPFRVL